VFDALNNVKLIFGWQSPFKCRATRRRPRLDRAQIRLNLFRHSIRCIYVAGTNLQRVVAPGQIGAPLPRQPKSWKCSWPARRRRRRITTSGEHNEKNT